MELSKLVIMQSKNNAMKWQIMTELLFLIKIIETGGKKIAFIGVATPQTL